MANPDCEKRPERQNPAYGRKSSVASKDSDKKGRTRLADAVQNFPFRMLGFGLIYAWSYCVWDVPSLDLASHATPLHGSDLWLASAVITPIACILAAAIGRKRELSDLKPAYALGPALAALGTLCAALLPSLSDPGYSAMLAIAAIATGIGPVVLIVLWTCLFARIDSGLVETIVPASFVATLVSAFLIPNISGIAAVVTVTALPLISGALLKAAKRSVEAGRIEANDPTGGNAGAGNPLNIARAFIIILAVYGIGCLIPYVTQTELPVGIETQATMVGMLFAIALSIAIVLFSRHIDLSALFRWITAPFVFAAICAAFDNAQLAALSNVFLNIVFTGIEIIMILYFVRLSQKTSRTATLYIGIGECAAYTGVLIGYVFGPMIFAAVQAGSVDVKSTCLLVIGAFILFTLIVPSRDEAWSSQPGEIGVLLPESGAAATTTEAVAAPAKEVVSLEMRALALAREFGLSNRETEIFLLLARGRSRPYIRDALVLSKNTVATHIRHIYEKAGIHSQQELLDLVEAATDSI